ncbi:hypothetical protein ABZX75_08140 [Streptomyces sp. NPDC003038]|uniref:hypothetical protein n=1 Tax=unclassified Streptomyces TaxID=2593676 RepID=UPI0033A6C74E
MPSSPLRGVWRLPAAVLAVLCCAVAWAGAGAGADAGAGAGAGSLPSAHVAGAAAVQAAVAHAADRAAEGGTRRCDPAPGAPDNVPAVPARASASAEHGTPAGTRPALTWSGVPFAVPRAMVCVRGPDRPAPGPVELSVMRV